jgi:hypothetical protein
VLPNYGSADCVAHHARTRLKPVFYDLTAKTAKNRVFKVGMEIA